MSIKLNAFPASWETPPMVVTTTAYLTDKERLSMDGADLTDWPFTISRTRYGWFMYVPGSETLSHANKDAAPWDEVPKNLLKLLETLAAVEIWFLVLDSDAPPLEGVPLPSEPEEPANPLLKGWFTTPSPHHDVKWVFVDPPVSLKSQAEESLKLAGFKPGTWVPLSSKTPPHKYNWVPLPTCPKCLNPLPDCLCGDTPILHPHQKSHFPGGHKMVVVGFDPAGNLTNTVSAEIAGPPKSEEVEEIKKDNTPTCPECQKSFYACECDDDDDDGYPGFECPDCGEHPCSCPAPYEEDDDTPEDW